MLSLEILGDRGDVGEDYGSARKFRVENDWQGIDGLAVMSDRARWSANISHGGLDVWEIDPDCPIVKAFVVQYYERPKSVL